MPQPDIVTNIGIGIADKWKHLANKYGLDIEINGLPALSGFAFKSNDALLYKTLITQEMLKKGYLAANSVYSCIEHTPNVIDGYFSNLDTIFSIIKECEDGLDINSLLDNSVCHSAFKRLN